MATSMLDILDTDKKQSLIVELLEAHIKKCYSLANRPTQGFNPSMEHEKKKAWALKAAFAENLLNDIVIESNLKL